MACFRAGLVLMCVLSVPAVAKANPNLRFATVRFDRGVQLYEHQRYEEALEELRASMVLYASPNTRLYIGRALRELGRLAEAAAELEMAAREAKERQQADARYAATHEAARQERAALEAKLGRLLLQVDGTLPSGARIRVAGDEVPRAAWGIPIAVTPGPLHVLVSTPHGKPIHRRVSVEPGAEVVVELEAPVSIAPEDPGRVATSAAGEGADSAGRDEAPAAKGTGRSAAGWVGVGVAALALVGTTVLAWQTQMVHSELQQCDQALRCSLSGRREELASRGRTLAALTYTSAATATLAGAFGAWFLLRPRSSSTSRDGGVSAGLEVRGTF